MRRGFGFGKVEVQNVDGQRLQPHTPCPPKHLGIKLKALPLEETTSLRSTYHHHPRRFLASVWLRACRPVDGRGFATLATIAVAMLRTFFLSIFASALLCMSLAYCFGSLSSSRFSNLWRGPAETPGALLGSLVHALVLFCSGPSRVNLS